MYLKTLYIQGFKSFAQKTKIEFNHKITGIVGPNGSGKSNISDAIMWVLGETSVKTLRGTKMEDVIFSGTDKKRPLGFAEVTIVFDNSDRTLPLEYNEVSVTRRMYRSLESEFLINSVKCRLKDIKELFMDTGIGKDGYSLIGQGKVESILSNRPEQRRAVFEEAAGISKYKMRKLESENKLKKTEENIVRLNDIISEIEQREKVLRIESENAIKYKNLFEELKSLEITNAFNEIEKHIKNNEKYILREEEFLTEVGKLKIKLEELEVQKSLISKEIDEIELEIEKLQKEELEDNKLYEREISQLNLIVEKKETLEQNLNRNFNTIDELKAIIKNREAEKNNLIDKLKNIRDLEEEKNINLNKLKDSLEISVERRNEIEKKLDLDNSRLIELHREKSEIESRISIKTSLIEEKEDRLKSINKNLAILEENNLEIERSLRQTDEKKAKVYETSKLLKTEKINLTKAVEELQNEVNTVEEQLQSYKSNFEKENAKYIALKNLADNFEGYNKSVKSFMNFTKKRNLFSDGLIGPVADNIKVDSKYEKAISVALGSSSQNIIVEDENDAKEMINLLNREKLGRITFLPIGKIEFKKTNLDLSKYKDQGILGYGDELIDYDFKYKNIFKSLLGRTIVAVDFDSALSLSKKLKNSYRIVTLKGDSLNIGGSITGGNLPKNNTDILGRKNEIEAAKKEVRRIQNLYNRSLEIFNESKSKLEKLKSDLVSTDEKIFKTSEEILSLERTVENINNSMKNNDSYMEKYNEDRIGIEGSMKEDRISLAENTEKLKKVEEALLNVSNKNDEIEEQLNELKNEIDNKIEKNNDEKLEIVKIQNEILNIEKEIKRIEDSNLADGERIESALKENETILVSIEDLQIGKVELEKKLSEIHSKIDNFSNELSEKKKIKDEKKSLHSKYLEESYQIQNTNYELENKITKVKSDMEKISFNIDSIVDRMNLEYGVSKSEISNLIENITNKELTDRIKNLKTEIYKLGEVNLFSIDEYRTVSERLKFNLEQKEDLLNSREEIKSILKKLNDEMKVRFKESFSKISKYFDEIFKILFNGGRAEIEIDGEDVLNSGIEIKAQPPGKRFQSLSLLSGGERSLTAVALLFALLKVRPAPFCILDEIDAALDDANIKRYADYLKSINDIQFIIITHRKLTMEIANVLYGVTMEERGVSKIISVELKS
ncbi:chromosome segregation protein SMC [Anaerosphaera multitolerans]|uniref:Chromosome partition protein Smc n=1 Tax=Anaerosphaera multitolerans TaxID=2487351 RepID=A0A437S8Y4_9FIRM|nr:chromosome segregation protein SMC [Anaerosphaera multitolerans]RVU55297.1 chromosome segregation protein SMC [Anaerosphaera multitolerans]